MKKIIVMTLSFILVFGNTSYAAEVPCVNSQNDTAATKEELYKNIFITMIYPYVEKAIQDYYSQYLTYLPGEDPWSYKFLKIEKTPGKNYSYTVQLEAQPYVGPHLSVGADRITLGIDLGQITIEQFEHIKSYELPFNYQDIIKKKLSM
ncbi:MAG: DUF3888 domain-containing protein [Bacillota bacterium]|nr:DUF3888 domain-containing protein [Bacillota bacterium]